MYVKVMFLTEKIKIICIAGCNGKPVLRDVVILMFF